MPVIQSSSYIRTIDTCIATSVPGDYKSIWFYHVVITMHNHTVDLCIMDILGPLISVLFIKVSRSVKHHLRLLLIACIMQVSLFSSVHINRLYYISVLIQNVMQKQTS